MLRTAKIVGFIPSKSFKKAKAFYNGKLRLRLVSEDNYALVFDANGTTLRIAKVEAFEAAEYTILGWEISRIDTLVATLRKRGVKFMRYSGMGQDKLGIWNSPSGARVAWFKDGDGNILSLTEHA